MVGCGGYAAYLIDRLAELPDDCQLVAVTALDLDGPAAQACRTKGLGVYRGVDELLDNLDPETCPAIVVSTSIESHFGFAEKIIARGFHVLLEKPPVVTIQDLDRLIKLQRKSRKFIAVNFQHLFSPMTQQLKKRISGTEFGAIQSVRVHALWTRPESYSSRSNWCGRLRINGQWVLDGTLGNPLAHLLAEALYLATPKAGMATPVNIQAELYHANEIESEDTSCLRIKTKDGVSVFYCASLASKDTTSILCEIKTERALIRLVDYFQVEIAWLDGRNERDETPDNNVHLDRRIMLKAVIGKLAKNERPPITVEECRPYMLAWNGAFESTGIPSAVTPSSLIVEKVEQEVIRTIYGLEKLVQNACQTQCLFSELDVPWATPGSIVDVTHYLHFPSIHPDWIALEQPSNLALDDHATPAEPASAPGSRPAGFSCATKAASHSSARSARNAHQLT